MNEPEVTKTTKEYERLKRKEVNVAFRIVRMQVPELMQSGESFWLNCSFDQGQTRLYSLKWYKDGTEFYRYIRQDTNNGIESMPMQSSFDLPGIHVERSQIGNVYLTGSDLRTSGHFRCEISADAPTFQTVRVEKQLQMYTLPLYGQEVWIEGVQSFYYPNELAELTCRSGRSSPPAQLHWTIDGQSSHLTRSCDDWTLDDVGLGDNGHHHLPLPVRSARQQSEYSFDRIDGGSKPVKMTSTLPSERDSQLSLSWCIGVQQDDGKTISAKCEAVIRLNVSRSSELTLIEKRNQMHYVTNLDGDGTRITGMADTEVTQNSVVSLGCHSKSARSQKPTRLRWLLNGIEAPFDLIRPLPAGGLFENELSLALHFRLDTAFWTKWSNTREIGGRRSLIIKCEALYTKTLLHSERTVTLHVRQVSDNLQSPADYLQKHSVSCENRIQSRAVIDLTILCIFWLMTI